MQTSVVRRQAGIGVTLSLRRYLVSYFYALVGVATLSAAGIVETAMGDHILKELVVRGSGRSSQTSISPRGLIAYSQTLDTKLLNLLLSERVSVICVRGFYPTSLCDRLSKWLSGHSNRSNTRRPHAVVAFSSGRRVSYSCFMKHDPGQPLRFHS
jgi:hypothetical protein